MTTATTSRTIEHLVVPLDESDAAARALPVAVGFAERLGAHIEMLSVADEPAHSAELHEHVSRLARQVGAPVESSDVIESDDVAEEVGRRIRGRRDSMIVISSHGPTRTAGVLTDSLTAELLADGASVVIVGPHAVAHSVELPVVACLDGSAESEQVLPHAAMWAQQLRVPLVLLIVTRPHLGLLPNTVMIGELASFDPEPALQTAAALVADGWPELDVVQRVVNYPWNVADALSIYLDHHPAQLIAVATHVRQGWARLTHPSATTRIVRQVVTPVLVVPIEATPAEPQSTASSLPVSPSSVSGWAVPNLRPFDEVIAPIGPDQITVSAAVAVANNLAVAGNAQLTFLTCYDDDADHPENERRRVELTELLQPTRTRWHVVESGNVADAIIDRAASAPGSIVCLATRAAGQLVETLMPTTTGQVIRWSPRTVVLVGPHCRPADGTYSEIVGCVDGSLVSESVAELAAFWAHSFGVSVRILEVAEPEATPDRSASVADRYVRRLAERVALHHGVDATGETIEDTNVSAAIRHWAEDHPKALLVMASHGVGLSEHVLGGVVMDVVRHAPMPVVVVPAHPLGDRVRPPSTAGGWSRDDFATAKPTKSVNDEFAIEMDVLDPRACWRLMIGVGFGRVVFTRDAMLYALPVNCGIAEDTIVFRTARDSMLHGLGDGASVAFEMDHTDRIAEGGWSVLVRGRAYEITDAYEQERLADLGVRSWAPGSKNRWIRIVPSEISGRRIRRHRVTKEPLPYMPPD